MKPVLFNIDCNCLFTDVFPPLAKGVPYSAKILHDYIDLLADSGVTTVLMNPNGQVPWYPSRALPHIITGYRRGDREFVRGHFPPTDDSWFTPPMLEERLAWATGFLNRYLDLVDAGVDWLAEIAKACRRRGLSPWLSIRMNDRHGGNNWEKSFFNCPPQRDPRCRLKGLQPNPRDGVRYGEMSLNYERREVRDYMFTMIRELVQEYNFDGLELDWMFGCCDPPASAAATATITGWFAELRALTRARAQQTGRPYPLGVRVPSRLGLPQSLGMDIPEIARRGLIDHLSPCNAWQTSWDIPYDRLRRALPESLRMYGVIEDAPNWLETFVPARGLRSFRLLSLSEPLLRGNADGIICHNFFCSDDYTAGLVPNPDNSRRQAAYPALHRLSDLEFLRGQPKHYTLSSRLGLNAFPLVERSEQLPAIIEPDWKCAFALSMCREPADRHLRLIVQVVVEKKDKLPDIGVSFNGRWPSFAAAPTDELLFPCGIFTHHVPEHQAFNYTFDVGLIQEGWNEVLVINGSHDRATEQQRCDNSIHVVSMELAVKP